jgi:hypothetical protein
MGRSGRIPKKASPRGVNGFAWDDLQAAGAATIYGQQDRLRH